MLRMRRMHGLQTFAAVHSSAHNHVNSDRNLFCRDVCKLARTAPSPSGGGPRAA